MFQTYDYDLKVFSNYTRLLVMIFITYEKRLDTGEIETMPKEGFAIDLE